MRKILQKSEKKELNERILGEYRLEFIDKKDKVELIDDVYFKNDEPVFFIQNNKLIPTLKLILKNNFLKNITVDMGAVKFVVNGADIMRPGIVQMDEDIEEGEVICVIDTTHSKPLAIGIALFSGRDMQKMSSGKAVKNMHWVGDKIWISH
ncbi:DUF1947 domain-containing protein [Candidatus Woesearchaeota archaeon]|nr:DUF1947 domain-containing protein [Candidatus Woesearchaeota archaeon]